MLQSGKHLDYYFTTSSYYKKKKKTEKEKKEVYKLNLYPLGYIACDTPPSKVIQ